MKIEMARVLIRPFCEEDAGPLHELLLDPAVMRWIEPPFSWERTQSFLRKAGLDDPPLIYAVIEKESGALIGQLIWHPWDENSMELGWILRRDRWGRGVASELTAAMLKETDGDVVLECAPGQTVTERIAVRFGFSLEESGALLRYRLRRSGIE